MALSLCTKVAARSCGWRSSHSAHLQWLYRSERRVRSVGRSAGQLVGKSAKGNENEAISRPWVCLSVGGKYVISLAFLCIASSMT